MKIQHPTRTQPNLAYIPHIIPSVQSVQFIQSPHSLSSRPLLVAAKPKEKNENEKKKNPAPSVSVPYAVHSTVSEPLAKKINLDRESTG